MKKAKYQKDIELFLQLAENEFSYLKWDLQGKNFTPVCFWSHQVMEKSLKALWAFYERKPIKIHKLVSLIKGIEDLIPEISKFLESAKFLDAYYIETRYGAHGSKILEPVEEEAQKARGYAERVLVFVKKKLAPEI